MKLKLGLLGLLILSIATALLIGCNQKVGPGNDPKSVYSTSLPLSLELFTQTGTLIAIVAPGDSFDIATYGNCVTCRSKDNLGKKAIISAEIVTSDEGVEIDDYSGEKLTFEVPYSETPESLKIFRVNAVEKGYHSIELTGSLTNLDDFADFENGYQTSGYLGICVVDTVSEIAELCKKRMEYTKKGYNDIDPYVIQPLEEMYIGSIPFPKDINRDTLAQPID